jgi:hypothetical protein
MVLKLAEGIPKKTQVAFFENKKLEWRKVLELSENKLTEPNQDESSHWKKINDYAAAQIKKIEEEITLLETNAIE